ncbi:DUF6572 domain-containing protein [Caballeronia sp. BR00000012568055]|uniref:DUF6572 domain-containing protein n=1 Tax=Caballeronia sp. BR00000012568055 TaxID=2918761 RepID=UPI0023F8C3B3|nr:DUF6572 domain-containing protein [Caballeronia sp. BR00000012568055]
MSVRDVEAIDYVGVNILFKKVYVGIFDELDWQDESEHRNLLTRKIDHCIRHIRSGQLLANYPKVRGYEIVIEYVSMHPMTQAGLEFWKSREHIIRQAGFDVRTRGVNVRGSLGLKVEEVAEREAPVLNDLVEPAPLKLENIEVLDADPLAGTADYSDVSFLPPPSSKPRNRHNLPVLTRLSGRRAAAH